MYAQYLLHVLMSVHKVWPYISFYDINCRFGPHFRKVAAECGSSGLWPPHLAAWASQLHTPLPPFHKYMHSSACAARHAMELLPAAGLGVGEPTEVLNRYIGIAGTVLQYASKAVRAVWLEVLLLAWQDKKEQDLPMLLWRMWCKACVQQTTYHKEQKQLGREAMRLGANRNQVGRCRSGRCRSLGRGSEHRGGGHHGLHACCEIPHLLFHRRQQCVMSRTALCSAGPPCEQSTGFIGYQHADSVCC